jgi:hypothetical protein
MSNNAYVRSLTGSRSPAAAACSMRNARVLFEVFELFNGVELSPGVAQTRPEEFDFLRVEH